MDDVDTVSISFFLESGAITVKEESLQSNLLLKKLRRSCDAETDDSTWGAFLSRKKWMHAAKEDARIRCFWQASL